MLGSKASGEPSLLLAVSVLHALRMAAIAARSDPAHRTAEPVPAPAAAPACAGGVGVTPPTSGSSGALLPSLQGLICGAGACPNGAPAQVCPASRRIPCMLLTLQVSEHSNSVHLHIVVGCHIEHQAGIFMLFLLCGRSPACKKMGS